MSNVSHELLTPTSILQSRFENMLQDPTLPEQHGRQIVESQRTLYRLRNTVRTLLLIANIENEQYLRDESVSLTQTVADVAEELSKHLRAEGMTILTRAAVEHVAFDGQRVTGDAKAVDDLTPRLLAESGVDLRAVVEGAADGIHQHRGGRAATVQVRRHGADDPAGHR